MAASTQPQPSTWRRPTGSPRAAQEKNRALTGRSPLKAPAVAAGTRATP